MNAGEIKPHDLASSNLVALIDDARRTLETATSAAEVLEARDMAGVAYDAARSAARLARAKGAHDEVLSAALRLQADALEIEALAKRRLADEYDAAQADGEVRSAGRPKIISGENNIPGSADLDLTAQTIHEARGIRDALVDDPDAVREVLKADVDQGREPTRAGLRRSLAQRKAQRNSTPQPVAKPTPRKGRKLRRQAWVNIPPEDWQAFKAQSRKLGVSASDRFAEWASTALRGDEPEIDPTTLPQSAQAKVQAAIRQAERRVLAEHAARANNLDEEVRLQVVERGKQYREAMAQREREADESHRYYEKLINNHKPLLTSDEFMLLHLCVRGQASEEKQHRAGTLLNEKRFALTGGKP